jgi:hypothetical protein
MSLRMNVSLVKCGTCGKRYSNPLTHTCVTTRARRRPSQIAPRLTYDCPRCGKPATNPLTHVCKTRSDFRRRLADQKRRQAREKRARRSKRPARPQHDYHSCTDPDCQRRACQAYREGIADCPREHT